MTEKELQYKVIILDLLIAIDKDIIDWRNHTHLWDAIRAADVALDLWAGDNLEQIRNETHQQYLNQ
jgi:hypothetical protein